MTVPPSNALRNEVFTNQRLPNTNRGLVNNTSFRSPEGYEPVASYLREHLLPQVADWQAGLERMRGHPSPQGFRERDWHQLKVDSLALLSVHGPHLAVLGWLTEELFGLDRDRPAVRVAASGLARFIHGGSVIESTGQFARIRHLTGSVLTYYRTDPQSGAVPAWKLHQQQEDNDMPDYSMDFDAGQTDTGPWLTWHAAPTRDGAHAAGTWSVRDSAARTTVNLTAGLVLDWPAAQTGWMQTGGITGVAPQKKWNPSRAKFERQPGDDWKRAVRVPVAYTPEGRAIWEQASAAAWMGFCDLMALLKDAGPGNLPNLPLVSFTGHRQVKLGNGVTLVPTFKLIRFVPRPLCLPDDDAVAQPSGDTWGGSSAPARTHPPNGNGAGVMQAGHAVSLPTGALPAGGGPLLDDEIPFAACVL